MNAQEIQNQVTELEAIILSNSSDGVAQETAEFIENKLNALQKKIHSIPETADRQLVLHKLLTDSQSFERWLTQNHNEALPLSRCLVNLHEQNIALSNPDTMILIKNELQQALKNNAFKNCPTNIQSAYPYFPVARFLLTPIIDSVQRRIYKEKMEDWQTRIVNLMMDLVVVDFENHKTWADNDGAFIMLYLREGCYALNSPNLQRVAYAKAVKQNIMDAIYELEKSILKKDSPNKSLIPLLLTYLQNMLNPEKNLCKFMDIKREYGKFSVDPENDRENTGTRKGIRKHITRLEDACVSEFLNNNTNISIALSSVLRSQCVLGEAIVRQESPTNTAPRYTLLPPVNTNNLPTERPDNSLVSVVTSQQL